MNLEKQKETKWIKVCQLQPTKVTFWPAYSEPLFPARSTLLVDAVEKVKVMNLIQLTRQPTCRST